jgi:RNA polymerase sigma-70 factor (ECF subfamily)
VSSIPNELFAGPPVDLGDAASRYSPILFRIALRRLRNREDAEDAVQNAFLSASRHIGQFEGRSQLSSWLTRIVINAAGMQLRNRPRYEVVSLDRIPEDGETSLGNRLVDTRPNPETICIQTEMEDTLHAALARVSSRLRIAFHLRETAGLTTQEAAQVLGITPCAFKSRVNRARIAITMQLRELTAAKPGDEPPITSRTVESNDPFKENSWQIKK